MDRKCARKCSRKIARNGENAIEWPPCRALLAWWFRAYIVHEPRGVCFLTGIHADHCLCSLPWRAIIRMSSSCRLLNCSVNTSSGNFMMWYLLAWLIHYYNDVQSSGLYGQCVVRRFIVTHPLKNVSKNHHEIKISISSISAAGQLGPNLVFN